jgi:hypothetical protein
MADMTHLKDHPDDHRQEDAKGRLLLQPDGDPNYLDETQTKQLNAMTAATQMLSVCTDAQLDEVVAAVRAKRED